MQRFERGDNIPRHENVSWLRRHVEKLRGIYASVACRRSSDVAIPPPSHRPPRHSVQRSEGRPSVQRSEPRRSMQERVEPRPSSQQPPPSQPGSTSYQQPPSSSWQQPPPDLAGSSFYQQPPTSQLGGFSSHHHQMDIGNTTLYILLNSVGSPINFTCFTLLQSVVSRSSSCIQSSHRCLVVVRT